MRSVKDGHMEERETLTGICHPCSLVFSLPLTSLTRQTCLPLQYRRVTSLLSLLLCDLSSFPVVTGVQCGSYLSTALWFHNYYECFLNGSELPLGHRWQSHSLTGKVMSTEKLQKW